ncbi:hypothetical protein NC653_000098 [Populus alba x Populus x berolinensis]|uniref:Uncharacterized protein n=1 Tax=Populus alba x Populus x berolinensis TaxID=444605 RepID=A0AAD6RHW2_9ROSI|nr:hypothetical protein NC653_000098 [Populus alba x Populus x berolinensis]
MPYSSVKLFHSHCRLRCNTAIQGQKMQAGAPIQSSSYCQILTEHLSKVAVSAKFSYDLPSPQKSFGGDININMCPPTAKGQELQSNSSSTIEYENITIQLQKKRMPLILVL